MCLTLPSKVISLNEDSVEIFDGRRQKTVLLGSLEALKVGDWVLSSDDFLINKISEAEAKEITDLIWSNYEVPDINEIDQRAREIMAASETREITREEVEYLLSVKDEKTLIALYSEANLRRKRFVKDHVCVHGIIEFSSYCANNCLYCGLRRDNDCREKYRMEPEEIIEETVKAVEERGYKIIVLQSGDDAFYTKEKLVYLIGEIKKRTRVFLYLSIGDRTVEEYRVFKEAGANGVLYRFESSNQQLYEAMHPGKKLADRLELLKAMKQLGYVIATGSIIGLPGQEISDLANDIFLVKELGAFMPSFGPFVASHGTPLENKDSGDSEMVLKVMAIMRFIMPASRIPLTTAYETIRGEAGRKEAFLAGANSLMFNLTPDKYRKNYSIYDNKFYDAERKIEKWSLFKGETSYQMLEEEVGFKI